MKASGSTKPAIASPSRRPRKRADGAPLPSWRAGAAYLYALQLDGPSLAWEYLRRNPEYRYDWYSEPRDPTRFITRWGLELPEDPGRDARVAHPIWRIDPTSMVRIIADDCDDPTGANRFCLWSIPGRKVLTHDGRRLVLTAAHGNGVVRLAVANDLCDGGRYSYVVRADANARARLCAVDDYTSRLQAAEPVKPYVVRPRPGRVAMLHMRALQALDGVDARASHRDIAHAVFGDQRAAQEWHPDSELRAQVRHLIGRAQAFMRGGYRSLVVNGTGHAQGDERT